jgi:hypothetical protein
MEPETYDQYLRRLHCGHVDFDSLAKTIWMERFEHKSEVANLRLRDAQKEEVLLEIKNAQSLEEVQELITDFNG